MLQNLRGYPLDAVHGHGERNVLGAGNDSCNVEGVGERRGQGQQVWSDVVDVHPLESLVAVAQSRADFQGRRTGIDANDFPPAVNERPSRVPGIQWDIRLYDVVDEPA